MAIHEGVMPNLDLIWRIQKQEQNAECFGRKPNCSNYACRWHEKCHEFCEYDPAYQHHESIA